MRTGGNVWYAFIVKVHTDELGGDVLALPLRAPHLVLTPVVVRVHWRTAVRLETPPGLIQESLLCIQV